MFNIRDQEQAITDAQSRIEADRQVIKASTQATISACQNSLIKSALNVSLRKGISWVGKKGQSDLPKENKRHSRKKIFGVIGIALSAWLIFSNKRD